MSLYAQSKMQSLPRELVEQIERVLDSRQTAQRPSDLLIDFNAVDTLNALFSDEGSLVQVESVSTRLKEQHAELQREIAQLRDELKQEQDVGRMQTIQSLIGELLAQMTRIREKATESEAIVRELTKDIQALDIAKKNIVLSLTTLKRFQILVNDLGHLESLIKLRKYAEIAQTLAAAKQIAVSFRPYISVDRIGIAWKRMQELQGTLRSCLDEDFDAFFLQDKSRVVKATVISNACLAVDVMGEDVRLHLIDRYCSIELREYRRIFRASDEAGQLDNISRRFAWFRRLLTIHDEHREQVFPPSWKVAQHLCAKFAEITRDDLTAALTNSGPKLTVTLLLDSLQQTLDFESMISGKFGLPFLDIVSTISTIARPPTTLSSAFDPHMSVFVDAQDKALADMLAAYRGPKSRTSLDEVAADSNHPTVLPSSADLFYFYRQNLDQCAKLSTKSPLFDLCSLHKKWLRIYAEDVLTASLKRGARERKSFERRSMEERANVAELKNACLVLNTAEYCQVTALQLEERIKDKISDEYKDRVTLQPERDLFVSVIASAITLQLRELEAACDAAFLTMARSSWNDAANVSGPSNSINGLVRAISSVADVLRENVEHKKWLRNFCDKAASLIITLFTHSLVRSRPIKEVSAEQILIDLQTLRTCLLDLPGPQPADGPSNLSYARNITANASNLETLLKVIIAPVVPADAFVHNYTVLIGDMSFSNFQKILDLKGTPRVEQNSLLDTFLAVISTKEGLESTSFLSSLDMDPDTNKNAQPPPNLRALTSPNVGSRVTLPSLLVGTAALTSDDSAGVGLGPGGADRRGDPRREVFSDFKRFMNFGGRQTKPS